MKEEKSTTWEMIMFVDDQVQQSRKDEDENIWWKTWKTKCNLLFFDSKRIDQNCQPIEESEEKKSCQLFWFSGHRDGQQATTTIDWPFGGSTCRKQNEAKSVTCFKLTGYRTWCDFKPVTLVTHLLELLSFINPLRVREINIQLNHLSSPLSLLFLFGFHLSSSSSCIFLFHFLSFSLWWQTSSSDVKLFEQSDGQRPFEWKFQEWNNQWKSKWKNQR